MIDDAAEAMQAGGVAQDLPDGDVGLAVLRELRPVRGDPLVIVEFTAVGEHMRARRGDTLGGGEAHGQRVTLPAVALRRPGPTPQVDDQSATVVDGHGGTAVGMGDLLAEDVGHLIESCVAVAGDEICWDVHLSDLPLSGAFTASEPYRG
ncbi:hypothetical protein NWF22_02030 [Gordonia mangrovi]|nr:hypothetical protein [Gordonia mangrovi]UVF78677.1 hypothetical protein NWF22_02030 [Gordonia mangrovi]